ncbi:putative metal-dependent hydrolase [Caenibius tardaugens NBRC 16725]|uniref:Putative metal-dependent hydrolase n=1 Tax=Caenibius tardaugens NBRC 16725 TaxID=1219035 RepID=U3A2R5_9SPHN|nr:endonuclease/exonuclease/phosphatase family protein [Caenibius tardaugens]AZI35905.1 endonuclease [Caenibius tardaugens NBRC 16725]GAD49048.1 putative metal-dependent hydrolase [Caenibius tardaugens NBRC 16725]
MELTFASYNIRKAVGLDRRRDPERILAILNELGADVVALQEADRRFGQRLTALPRQMLEDHHWQIAPVALRPLSIGWHGNALLVRRGIDILDAEPLDLPTVEPRGAVRVDLAAGGKRVRVVGMHLDLSGLRRRHQVQTVLGRLGQCEDACPTVLMGDFNEWSTRGGCLRVFADDWRVLAPGRSFPSRQPVAQLDRIVASPDWHCREQGVHHSALSARASDHLPVWARLGL